MQSCFERREATSLKLTYQSLCKSSLLLPLSCFIFHASPVTKKKIINLIEQRSLVLKKKVLLLAGLADSTEQGLLFLKNTTSWKTILVDIQLSFKYTNTLKRQWHILCIGVCKRLGTGKAIRWIFTLKCFSSMVLYISKNISSMIRS